MPKGICTIEDCSSTLYCRGWCSKHYSRWRKWGDPLRVRPLAKNLPCGAPGCDRNQRLNGYCETHNRRVKKYGDPEGRRRDKVPCIGPQCDRLVGDQTKTGLCGSHYRQVLDGRPLAPLVIRDRDRPQVCQFPDCGRPNKGHGLCAAHKLQRKKGQELRPVKAISREWRACVVDGCEQMRICRDWCERHYSTRYRRWLIYGITPERGLAMYDAQGGRCPVCQEGLDLDDLHIDHDHSCCPSGKKGCGQCVRGLLCGRCNKGLGYFADNAAHLRSAAAYIEATTTT